MTDDELLEMYEREWKKLMDEVNEVEEKIVHVKNRIAKNAAQPLRAVDGGDAGELEGDGE